MSTPRRPSPSVRGQGFERFDHNSTKFLHRSFFPNNRFDPTKTTVIRAKYSADLKRRFVALRRAIKESIVDNDAFGLNKRPAKLKLNQDPNQDPDGRHGANLGRMTTNQRVDPNIVPALKGDFEFTTDPQKLLAFKRWLNEQIQNGILESEINYQGLYVRSAYSKALEQANASASKAGVKPDGLTITALFNRPIHEETLSLLYTRNFEALKNITTAMSSSISRELATAFAEGISPRQMAVRLADRVNKIGIVRATLLARTETINVHATATLKRFEEFGLKNVSADVEFSTSGDDKVCSRCEAIDGKVFTLKQASGVIPVHPNCRCAWLPVIDVKPTKTQERKAKKEAEKQKDKKPSALSVEELVARSEEREKIVEGWGKTFIGSPYLSDKQRNDVVKAIAPPKTAEEMTRRLVGKWDEGDEKRQATAFEFLGRVFSPRIRQSVERPVDMQRRTGIRAYFSELGGRASGDNLIKIDKGEFEEIIIHELGHHIEGQADKTIMGLSRKWLLRRTNGGAVKKTLRELTGNKNYSNKEVAFEPSRPFFSPYVGKDYGQFATEVVSMGLEELYNNPFVFARKDPDHLNYILDVISGDVFEENYEKSVFKKRGK